MYAMLLSLWLTLARVAPKKPPGRRPTFRPRLETLEDRSLPSAYSAANASQLIADINAANAAGGSNTITLTAPTTSPYVLTVMNNYNGGNGSNGLPVIAANDNLTIVGNGDTIERSTASGTKPFRLLDVAAGASLTLQNLTLQGGYAWPVSAGGGAVYNQGALVLSGVTVADNRAQTGGGIWSNGSLTLENGTLLEDNSAVGPEPTGSAFGGAVYIAGGTANISNSTFTGNKALSGDESTGPAFGGALYVAAGQVVLTTTTVNANSANYIEGNGVGYGGGVYVAGGSVSLANDTVEANGSGIWGGGLYVCGGTVTLTTDTVQSNTANNAGGGIYLASGVTVYIDPFTLANVIDNTAPTDPNIDGTYILT